MPTSTPIDATPTPDRAATRVDPTDPTPPDQMLDQLRFMQSRLKRLVREAPDEDLARRFLFAKHWIDSCVARLRMDEELENSALLGLTEGEVSQ